MKIDFPVFIDNAEACNTVDEINGQSIKLYVSDDEKLRIERFLLEDEFKSNPPLGRQS